MDTLSSQDPEPQPEYKEIASTNTGEQETQPASLAYARASLIEAYAQAQRNAEKPESSIQRHETGFSSKPVRLTLSSSPLETSGRKSRYLFRVATDLADSGKVTVLVEEQPTQKGERRYPATTYELTDSGEVWRLLDSLDPKLVTSFDEIRLVKRSVDQSREAIEQSIREHTAENAQKNPQHKRNLGTRVMVSTLIAGGIVSGVYSGWYFGIHQPAAQEDLKRNHYDNQAPSLAELSNTLEGMEYTLLSDELFAQIPEYRSGDTFAMPRRISMHEDGCTHLPIQTYPETAISFAVPSSSSITSIDTLRTQNGVIVCAVDASSSGTEKTWVAMQLSQPE